MLISLLSILLIIALGMLNAREFISAKHPKLREITDRMLPYESYIGLGGIVLGLVGALNSLTWLNPVGVIGLLTGLLTFALGLMSASGFLKTVCFKDSANLQGKVDECTSKLVPYQQNMGLAAIILGIVYFLMMLGI